MYQIVPKTEHFLKIFRDLSFKKDKIKKQQSEFIKIMNRLFKMLHFYRPDLNFTIKEKK